MIGDLAGRQHRVVTRRQMLAAGISSEAIQHRLENGRLHVHHRGVYSVGIRQLDRHGRWLAAVLACGDRAVLSHRSAAELWTLFHPAQGPSHVTVPGTNGSRTAGIKVHATRALPRAEHTRRLRIPTTTIERTIVDIAPDPRIERAVEQAFVLNLIGRTRMVDALRRAHGKPGIANLRRIFAGLLDDFRLTRSELERLFLRLIADAALPATLVNRHREGHRVDFVWPDHRLVVETDGRATHDNPWAFHEDRRRDLDLELADMHVIRLSWWQIVDEPERVVQLLRKRLSRAR